MADTPAPEFPDNIAIRDYCGAVRKILHQYAAELDMAAAELEAALGESRGTTGMLGIDSRVRARLVARHMKDSAEALRASSAGVIRTYGSFRKHFMPELEAARKGRPVKPRFEFKPE